MKPKIIQILIAPNDATWQGILLGLGDDGVVYECRTGRWSAIIPEIDYNPSDDLSTIPIQRSLTQNERQSLDEFTDSELK